ncbi:hypothetical protein C809_02184 [Lachnospiraceae bacterium MD335]|nr:hypothetical protein C809_02184 [Lachnospiraceae bacterium MD335]
MKRGLSPWSKQCKVQMLVLEKSLDQLSKETGFSKSYLSSIINGRIIVPEETVKVISNALDVDMALIG